MPCPSVYSIYITDSKNQKMNIQWTISKKCKYNSK